MGKEKRRSPGGIGFTRRGNKLEATYNIPKSQLPPGRSRWRITAQGNTELEATAALLEKLKSLELAPALPGRITAAEEKQVRDWLGPDGKDVKGTRPAEYDSDLGPLLTEWVEEWKDRWINPELAVSSRNIYFGHIANYILPYLGKYHMNELSANILLDKWWKPLGELKKVKGGLLTDEPLLGDSVKSNIYKTLRLLITTCHHKHRTRIALTESLIKKPVPKRPESDREVREAAKKLEEIFLDNPNKDDPRWSLFMLAMAGVRQAERLAICTRDIDMDDPDGPTLTIHQQLDFDKASGGWVIKPTTKNGEARTIPLVGEYLEAVEKQLEWRNKWIAEAGKNWNPPAGFEDFLFLQPGGKLWTRRQDTPAWHEYVGPGIRGHLARHATGHMLARQGIPVATAMQLLGHKSEAMALYYRVASAMDTRRELEKGQAKRKKQATVTDIASARRRA